MKEVVKTERGARFDTPEGALRKGFEKALQYVLSEVGADPLSSDAIGASFKATGKYGELELHLIFNPPQAEERIETEVTPEVESAPLTELIQGVTVHPDYFTDETWRRLKASAIEAAAPEYSHARNLSCYCGRRAEVQRVMEMASKWPMVGDLESSVLGSIKGLLDVFAILEPVMRKEPRHRSRLLCVYFVEQMLRAGLATQKEVETAIENMWSRFQSADQPENDFDFPSTLEM